MKRVAVTGIGCVSPLGLDAPSTWRAALAGESGISWISTFDTDGLPVRVAGEVKGFEAPECLGEEGAQARAQRAVRRGCRPGAADRAHGLRPRPHPDISAGDRRRTGSSSRRSVPRPGPDRVSPSFLPNILVDTVSGQLAISLGIRGPNYAASRRATGSHAIGEAAEMIKRGVPTPSRGRHRAA